MDYKQAKKNDKIKGGDRKLLNYLVTNINAVIQYQEKQIKLKYISTNLYCLRLEKGVLSEGIYIFTTMGNLTRQILSMGKYYL